MKLKKWLKCLLMTMALMMVVNVGVVSTTLPVVAAKTKTETVKKGTTFWKGDLQYKVTSLKGKKGEATLIGAKSNVTSVTVPKTVKNGKYTLTVTVIGANAFKKCKKLETVTTNTVIKEIGKNAFKGCKKLAAVDIQSKALKKVGKNALKGISKEAVVTVPEGKDDSYEKLLNVPVQTPDEEDASAAAVTATEEEGTTPVTEAPAQTEAKTPETEAKAPEQTSAPASEANLTSAAPEESTLTPEVKASDAKATTQTEAKAPTEDETAAPTPDAPEKEAQAQTEAVAPTPTPDAPVQTEAVAPAPTPAPETSAPAKKTAPKMAQKKAPASAAPNATEPTPEVKTQTETETDAPTPAPEAETQPETKAAAPTPTPTPETSVQTEAETPAQKETATPTQTEAETPAETEHVCEFTWVVTKEPYCGYLGNDMTWRDTGSRTGTCVVCGKTVKEGLREEHEFEVTKNVEPTCTTRGATYSKCKKCGYQSISFKDENGQIREALGHNMVHHDDPATCTEDGRSYDQCERCGLVENETITKKIGHDFSGDVTVVKAATCTMDGYQVTACVHEGCSATWSKRIAATGHNFETETIPPTYTTDELIVTVCTNCDYKNVEAVSGTKLGQMQNAYSAKNSDTADGCSHVWKDVTELNEPEGALASMSGGKIKTQKCTECNEYRFVYNIAKKGEKANWQPWENVLCKDKGHTWPENADAKGHMNCTECGMPKPEGDGGTGSRDRIVWGVTIKAEEGHCVGFEKGVYSGILTTIANNCILVTAPNALDGYVFKEWTCTRPDANLEELYVRPEDKTTLNIPCDYMDAVFTATYEEIKKDQDSTEAVPASEVAAPSEVVAPADEPASAGAPQVIHAEMHIDLTDVLGDDLTAEDYSHEPHETVEHHEPVVVEGHTEAAE